MTSVAVLSSAPPTATSDAFSMSTPFTTTSLPQSKRPRLALNTTCSSNLTGRGGTGLRLDTLSANSPTTRNTFKNAFETTPSCPTTLRNTRDNANATNDDSSTHDETTNDEYATCIHPETTLLTNPTPSEARPAGLTLNTSFNQETPSTIKPPSPTYSLSSTDSSPPRTPKAPYTLSANQQSILSNSPIPRSQWANQTTTFSPVKRRFPPVRRVGFKYPLCEEIVNVRFQLSNFDIESREPSPQPEVEVVKSGKRHADFEDDEGDDDNDAAFPKTPVAGRRKKERNWVWTLGPVAGQINPSRDNEDTSPVQ